MKSKSFPDLFLRKVIWWMNFKLCGQSIVDTTGQQDEDLAYEVMMIRKREILQEDYERSKKDLNTMGLREAARLYEIEHLMHTPNWQSGRTRVNVIVEHLGNMQMHQIDRDTVKLLKRKLRERKYRGKVMKNISINKYINTLNSIMAYVNEHHDVDCPPGFTKIMEDVSKRDHRNRVITDDERTLIREWLANHTPIRNHTHWHSEDFLEIFDLFWHTGMRRGELFSFRVYQIRNNAIILDDHKTIDQTGERSIVLNKTARTLLEKRIKRKGLTHGDIVFDYPKRSWTLLWHQMRKAIGLQHDRSFVVHAIRHTFASRLAARGASIYDVSKMLGHSTVLTTERYAHLFNHQLVKTAELLDDE